MGDLLAAVLVVVAVGVSLLLPPIADRQVAGAVEALREPVVAVVVAGVVLAVGTWRRRVALGLLAVVVVFAAGQFGVFWASTGAWRDAMAGSDGWRRVALAESAAGTAENAENVFGQARLRWDGDRVVLRLSSKIGTTQQGLLMDAGSPDGSYVFTAKSGNPSGALTSTCPVLFGIRDTRSYFTFRLQSDGDGGFKAFVYEIVPNDPAVLTSGFRGVLFEETEALPYVKYWNVVRPWEGEATRLTVAAVGDRYSFYVNDRLVGSRQIDGAPPHVVAVGATVLNTGGFDDTVCEFADVELRVR